MLESNSPMNSQLETHRNGELGRRPWGRRPHHSDRFPYAFKTHQVKSPQSGIHCSPAQTPKIFSFKWPWLHFLEGFHSSGRGFSVAS